MYTEVSNYTNVKYVTILPGLSIPHFYSIIVSLLLSLLAHEIHFIIFRVFCSICSCITYSSVYIHQFSTSYMKSILSNLLQLFASHPITCMDSYFNCIMLDLYWEKWMNEIDYTCCASVWCIKFYFSGRSWDVLSSQWL